MLKKILQMLLNKKSHYRRYSSSGYKKKSGFGQHPSKYGHQYYKKKGRYSRSSYSS